MQLFSNVLLSTRVFCSICDLTYLVNDRFERTECLYHILFQNVEKMPWKLSKYCKLLLESRKWEEHGLTSSKVV
jgi:hypothetical protein